MTTTSLTLDPTFLSLVAGAIIPLAVAAVTKSALSSSIKAALSLGLSAIAGTLIQISDAGGAVAPRAIVIAIITTAVTATAAYVGVWKPIVNPNARLAPTKGIGPVAPPASAPAAP